MVVSTYTGEETGNDAHRGHRYSVRVPVGLCVHIPWELGGQTRAGARTEWSSAFSRLKYDLAHGAQRQGTGDTGPSKS